jgi:hypothetical protein
VKVIVSIPEIVFTYLGRLRSLGKSQLYKVELPILQTNVRACLPDTTDLVAFATGAYLHLGAEATRLMDSKLIASKE